MSGTDSRNGPLWKRLTSLICGLAVMGVVYWAMAGTWPLLHPLWLLLPSWLAGFVTIRLTDRLLGLPKGWKLW